jgi:hypothetical protein
MLKDIDIRQKMIERLLKQSVHHPGRIIPELAVCDGNARVDIAVANGRLQGYEIKSDRDTLDRLPAQLEAYNKTFDTMTIIVGKKYENKVIEIIPDWWGILVADLYKNGTVRIVEKRKPKLNHDVEAMALLELLWREEILSFLKRYELKSLSNKNRRKLRDITIEAISQEKITFIELKNFTRETLKHREGWRAD